MMNSQFLQVKWWLNCYGKRDVNKYFNSFSPYGFVFILKFIETFNIKILHELNEKHYLLNAFYY